MTAAPGPTGFVCLTESASNLEQFENGQGRAARLEHEEGGTRHPS
jgi:hypothetical protein